MDAEQASQVLQRLQILEQAATEQWNARRNAEHALVEAQTKIAQVDQALQHGRTWHSNYTWWILVFSGGQTNGTEERETWTKWSFVMGVYARAIDQELSTDMTNVEVSTDVLSNEAMTGQSKAKSVQVYFVLIMLCTRRLLDRIAISPHGWGMEAWRLIFQEYSQKNNARLVVMMLEMLAFPLDTNDVVNSLETREQKIKGSRDTRTSKFQKS